MNNVHTMNIVISTRPITGYRKNIENNIVIILEPLTLSMSFHVGVTRLNECHAAASPYISLPCLFMIPHPDSSPHSWTGPL